MGIGGLGKNFEKIFKQCWSKSFPGTFIYRLKDQMTGYKITSQNPCDYLAYNNKQLWLLELKSHEGNTINFAAITQYDKLLSYKDMEGVNPYIIVWFIDHDKVVAVHIKEAEKMKLAGKKSISIKDLESKEYKLIDIPSVKKRVFLDSDYSCLSNLNEGE